jgi:hypothetical protein
MSNPGEMDSTAFEIMNKLAKHHRGNVNLKWEELLICCWRLGDNLTQFLKGIPEKDALAVLVHLPQNISIRVAREMMPGEWAVIFKKKPSDVKIDDAHVEKYRDQSLKIQPLRSIDMLDSYKRELDLIKYLKIVDPVMEKEIYGALPKDSSLHTARPPFFKIFDADGVELKDFVGSVPIEDWSWALLNLPRSTRVEIERCFTDRQKFRFIELIKQFDRQPDAILSTGEARERIAKAFSAHTMRSKAKIELVKESATVGADKGAA